MLMTRSDILLRFTSADPWPRLSAPVSPLALRACSATRAYLHLSTIHTGECAGCWPITAKPLCCAWVSRMRSEQVIGSAALVAIFATVLAALWIAGVSH